MQTDNLVIENGTITTHYRVKFTLDNPAPVQTVIQSLKGFDKLLKRIRPLVEKSCDITINKTEVYVNEIIEGSFIYDFIIKHVIDENDLTELGAIRDRLIQNNAKVRTVVAMGVGAVIYAAAQSFYQSYSATDAPPNTVIEAHNSVIINAGTDVNLTPQDIQAFQASVANDKDVTKDVINAIALARLEPDTQIILDEPASNATAQMIVTNEMINYIPSNIDHLTPQERSDSYENVSIRIFASDKDKAEKGWAGIVPDISDKRVKFTLSDNVNPAKLHGRLQVRAEYYRSSSVR